MLADASTHHLVLGPLSLAETETLLCRKLGVSRAPAEVIEFVYGRAEGHPLFTEELSVALRDAGLLSILDDTDIDAAGGEAADVFTIADLTVRVGAATGKQTLNMNATVRDELVLGQRCLAQRGAGAQVDEVEVAASGREHGARGITDRGRAIVDQGGHGEVARRRGHRRLERSRGGVGVDGDAPALVERDESAGIAGDTLERSRVA